MRVENLPQLISASRNMFSQYEVGGVTTDSLEEARKAEFIANRALLLEKLNAWHNGFCYWLRSHSLPLTGNWIAMMRKVRDNLRTMIDALRTIPYNADECGRFVWEQIHPLLMYAKPKKEHSQAMVNWIRAEHLTRLFIDRYGPEEAQKPHDEWAWADNAR